MKYTNVPPIINTPGTPNLEVDGYFAVGTPAIFFFHFPDINGNLYDPSEIEITITDADGTAVEEANQEFDKIELGVYAFTWGIPPSAIAGKYTLTLSFTSETSSGTRTDTLVQAFVVSQNTTGNINYRMVGLRSFLESLIGYTQRIPVFEEVARFNLAGTNAKLTFPRWNQQAGAEIRVNGDLKETGYSVDWLRGRITFDKAISNFDEVTVTYNFRWFEDSELYDFIQQGIEIFNQFVPQTVYTYANMPERYIITAQHAAAVLVLRRWMMDILFQEPVKVFGDPKKADQVFQHMDTLKKNYEEFLLKLLEQKKFVPYSGLTRTVTVPEFTLPGGRSRWFRYIFNQQ